MAARAKVDCKYGEKCYRKSNDHLKQFAHPKTDKAEDEDQVPTKKRKTEQNGKAKTITQFFAKKNRDESEDIVHDKTKQKISKEEKEPPVTTTESGEESHEETEEDSGETRPDSPLDVRENIKSKFLVEMPEDFYAFWKFCQSCNEDDPLEALQESLGFTLVGPYDVLAGRHKDVSRNSAGHRPNFLLHYRYFYDPPEFLTVIKGDDKSQFHLGYFRDDPSEMPVFVAANSAKENGKIKPQGENLFAAVSCCIGERLKTKGLAGEKKKELEGLLKTLKAAAEAGGFPLDLKTPGIKARDKKVVCKTFHGAGLVVPVDENDVGYRPVPESQRDLEKMLGRIRDSSSEEERDRHMEPLQEIITFIQFANDECDYGEGLELGLDLFTFGADCLHGPIESLLSLGYQLVNRPQYATIITEHLKNRQHTAQLSQID